MHPLLFYSILIFVGLLVACRSVPPAPERAAATLVPSPRTRTSTPLASPSATGTQEATHRQAATATRTPPPTPSPRPSTPPPSPTPTLVSLRFVVIGDFGMAGPAAEDVADLVKSWDPDLIITTGDNNYPLGAAETIDDNIGQYYHHYIYPYLGVYGEGADENRFFPILGNHDWDTAGAQPYLDYFALPGNERYYEVAWGPVRLFAVSSDSREPDGVVADSIQATWLQTRMAAAQEPSKIDATHLPPYSSGYHGSTGWMQWPYEAWGATIVLSGHDHLYERLIVDGFPYIVNGLGGFLRYPFNAPLPGSQVRFNADYGALRVEASAEEIRFQFITRGGEIVDTYTLRASGP